MILPTFFFLQTNVFDIYENSCTLGHVEN